MHIAGGRAGLHLFHRFAAYKDSQTWLARRASFRLGFGVLECVKAFREYSRGPRKA